MKFRIYKITSPTGLVYIGCTRSSLKQRFSGSYNKRLTEDFEKYGKENFKLELLREFENDSFAAKQAETEAIKQYDSTNPTKGYNLDKESDYPQLSESQMTQDKKTKVFSMRCTDDEQDFLNKALMWYRAQTMLVEIGSICGIPNIFKAGGQQIVSPTGIVSGATTELPAFVEDILNGGTYPNREDCTQEEAAVLYDAKFKVLYKAFLVAKNDMARQNIKQSMIQLVGEILA